MESSAFNIPLTRVNYSRFGGSISRIRETDHVLQRGHAYRYYSTCNYFSYKLKIALQSILS